MGYDLKIEDMAFEMILATVDTGKADFGAAGMTVNAEREKAWTLRTLVRKLLR